MRKSFNPRYQLAPWQEEDADKYFEAYDAAKAGHQDALIAKINLAALANIASKLRNYVPCSVPALGADAARELLTSQAGGQNLHVDIVFEDGVTWIARLRLDDPLLSPPVTRDLIVQSEVATLTFLARTKVPAPAVYHYTLSSTLDNVGVPYMLIDKLMGTPLDWQMLDVSKKPRVLSQLADIFIELRRHPLSQSGSLILDQAQCLSMGGFAQSQLFREPDLALGPFTSTGEAAQEIITFYREMYVSGELAKLPVDSYLAFVYRQSLVTDIYPRRKQQKFYLKHFDDKGDHILVDEEANITGIIDWEYASAESEYLAFSSPCMMWPVANYYKGNNELSAEEKQFAALLEQKGHSNLAEIVLNGRLHQRFWFFLGGGAPYDHGEFVALFNGLRKAYLDYSDDSAGLEPYEEWRQAALERCKTSDPWLQRLLRRERATTRDGQSI